MHKIYSSDFIPLTKFLQTCSFIYIYNVCNVEKRAKAYFSPDSSGYTFLQQLSKKDNSV